MNDTVFGAEEACAFNPHKEFHYAMSQEAELELRHLFQAIGFIGGMIEPAPGAQQTDFDTDHFGCILRTFAAHGNRIMMDYVGVWGTPK